MSLNDEVEALRSIPLFAKVEASKLKLLAFTSERLVFEPGEVLFHQGDRGDAAYVILDGEVEVIDESQAAAVVVATRGRHEIIGEIAILCDVPRTTTIKAKGRLETLVLSKDLFKRLMVEFPEIAVEIARVLAVRLQMTTTRLSEAMRNQGGTVH